MQSTKHNSLPRTPEKEPQVAQNPSTRIETHQRSWPKKPDSSPSEEELHIFRGEFVHGNLVVIDGPIDHVCFLLLQKHHSRLHRILDTQPSDHTWTFLANAMTPVSTLPFCGWVPPPAMCISPNEALQA
jgi:hypothetical protein